MAVAPPISGHLLTRRRLLIGSGALAAGFTLYAGEIARHELDIVHRTISLRHLPPRFDGHRIVQLSDIHLDEFTEPFFLERIVREVNALDPDLVLLTGDFITLGSLTFLASQHAAHRCAEVLSGLECPQRFAVLGNHDVGVSAPMVTAALEAHRIPVLNNKSVALDRGGDRLWIAGVADPGTSRPDLNAAIPAEPAAPVILMAHEPDYADVVIQHPRGAYVSLMLSGHSHGGQIRIPFAGPLILPPLGKKYVEGHFVFGRTQLYVNRGIGTVGLPFRLNCPPEITVFTLEGAS